MVVAVAAQGIVGRVFQYSMTTTTVASSHDSTAAVDVLLTTTILANKRFFVGVRGCLCFFAVGRIFVSSTGRIGLTVHIRHETCSFVVFGIRFHEEFPGFIVETTFRKRHNQKAPNDGQHVQ